MDAVAKEKWYEICKDFYVSHNPRGRNAIDIFERLSPDCKSRTSLKPGNLGNDSLECDVDVTFFQFIQKSDALWYELSGMKNQARSDAHRIIAERRLTTTKQRILDLQAKRSNDDTVDFDAVLRCLRKHVRHYGQSDGFLVTHFALNLWISKQENSKACFVWKMDIEKLSEQPDPFQISFLELLFTLGTYKDGDGKFEMKDCFSTAFLRRLRRSIHGASDINKCNTNALTNELENDIVACTTERRNINGELEDCATYIINRIPCALL